MSTARDKALLTIKAVDIISVSAAPRKVMQGPLFHPTVSFMPIQLEIMFSFCTPSCSRVLIQSAGG